MYTQSSSSVLVRIFSKNTYSKSVVLLRPNQVKVIEVYLYFILLVFDGHYGKYQSLFTNDEVNVLKWQFFPLFCTYFHVQTHLHSSLPFVVTESSLMFTECFYSSHVNTVFLKFSALSVFSKITIQKQSNAKYLNKNL